MSINRTDAIKISRRYANAAFDLAIAAKSEQALVEDISVLARAIVENKNLADTLNNPLIAHEQKALLLAALMKKGDALAQSTIVTIAKAGRANLIPTIAQQLEKLLDAHTGRIEARITSARTLSAAAQKQLQQSLAKATGKTVHLTLQEDESVLGGVRIELGSLSLDATLSGALTNMRSQLLAATHSSL